jgi:hypothetical protein
MNTVKCEYQNDGRRITQPGKFEGEPVFAPHYWDIALSGFADADDGKVFTFRFTLSGKDANTEFAAELKQWLGRKRVLRMREDDQGFVHCF